MKKCHRGSKADADCHAGYACQGSAPDELRDVANEGEEFGEK